MVEIEVHQAGHKLGHTAILDPTQIQAQAHQDLIANQVVVLLVAIQERLLLHQVM